MGIATIDFETYSEAGYVWSASKKKYLAPEGSAKKGLPAVGAARYARHESTEVLCLAYLLPDAKDVGFWRPEDPLRNLEPLFEHIRAGGLVEAWNVGFEAAIWEHACVVNYGFPQVSSRQWRCAMAKARAYSLPASLASAGSVLQISNQKDTRGKKLLDKYSKPRDPTSIDPKRRYYVDGTTATEDFKVLKDYNIRDVIAEHEISQKIPELTYQELEFWKYDQEINARGVQIDLESVDACIHIVKEYAAEATVRLQAITQGAVRSASEVARIRKFLKSHGVFLDSLDVETVTAALKDKTLPPVAREVLQIRMDLRSAAVKKLYAFKNRTCENGRLYDLFVYHAARTGRAASYGVQVHNMPNSGVPVRPCVFCKASGNYEYEETCGFCGIPIQERKSEWSRDAADQALKVIRAKSLPLVALYYGSDVLLTVSSCIRGLIVSAQGKELVCSDYSAIEAVVLAALAKEEWRLDVFRTHGKIYEMSASKISGVSFEEILAHKKTTGVHHPLRKSLGKVAELASGFGGGVGAWKRFGASEHLDDNEIQRAIYAWRDASPNIVRLWRGYQECAVNAVSNIDTMYGYNGIKFRVRPEFGREVLRVTLLSGRDLIYHDPKVDLASGRPELSYTGYNSSAQAGKLGWVSIRTYGGKLTENIVQATARDILMSAIVNLERDGYPVVLHIHDEIVCEMPEGLGSVEKMERIMCIKPDWARDWPISASGGWIGKRYGK